jgi:hypothetical protein
MIEKVVVMSFGLALLSLQIFHIPSKIGRGCITDSATLILRHNLIAPKCNFVDEISFLNISSRRSWNLTVRSTKAAERARRRDSFA